MMDSAFGTDYDYYLKFDRESCILNCFAFVARVFGAIYNPNSSEWAFYILISRFQCEHKHKPKSLKLV